MTEQEVRNSPDSPKTELPIQVRFLKAVFETDKSIIRKTPPEYGIPIAEYWNDLNISYERVGEIIGLTATSVMHRVQKGMENIWCRSPKQIQANFRLNDITEGKNRTGRVRSPRTIERMKVSAQKRREKEWGL
jgi:hypothetical protein